MPQRGAGATTGGSSLDGRPGERTFHDAGALELEFALELVIHKGDVILDVLKVGHLCNTLLHHLLLLPDICIKSGSSLQNAILVFSIQGLVTGTDTNAMHHGILVFTGEAKIEGMCSFIIS